MRTKLPQSTLQDTFTLTTVISAYRYENQAASKASPSHICTHRGTFSCPYVKKGIWKLKE